MGICTSAGYGDEQYHVLMKTPFAYRIDYDELRRFGEFFVVRQYDAGTTICSVNSDKAFFVLADGSINVVYDGNVLTTKGPGAFFGQLAAEQASMIERKTSFSASQSQEHSENAPPMVKRDSEIDIAARADIVALTKCECIVLDARAYKEFIRQCEDDVRDAVLFTMGAFITKSLRELGFFKSLSAKKVEVLSSLLHYVPLRENEVLFAEGSLGTSMYIMYQGRCKAVAREKDEAGNEKVPPHEVVLNTFKEGDFFGEISLIMGMPRTASIIATEPTLVLELRKDDFQNFLKLTPNLPFHDLMKRRFANHFKKYKVPFFSAIPEHRYSLLASLCKVEEIEAGTILFKEGDVGNSFYIIAHGEVVATSKRKVKGPDGEEKVQMMELSRMGPGKYFGEIALIRDTHRTATVTTTQRCVILSITKSNFESFFQEAPEALADFEVKLARYDVALRSVIYHPLGLAYFTKYLEKEIAAENIQFWKAARDYRHIGRATGGLLSPSGSVVPAEDNNQNDLGNKAALIEESDSAIPTPTSSPPPAPSSGQAHSQPPAAGDNGERYSTIHVVEITPQMKAELIARAKEILQTYIVNGARDQVNISGDLRNFIIDQVNSNNVDLSTFLAAEKEILTLLERDSFPRFKQSDLFRSFLDDADSYDEKEPNAELNKSASSDTVPRIRSGSVNDDEQAFRKLQEARARKTTSQQGPTGGTGAITRSDTVSPRDVTLGA